MPRPTYNWRSVEMARNFGISAFYFFLVRFVDERCWKKNKMATMLNVPAI